jgi:hypothetical protein
MVSLLTGVWGGLARLSVNVPLPADNANWLSFHGPLMVCGFLGTVIGLERAVGLPGKWAYAAPVLTGVGAGTLIVGMPGRLPLWLLTLGSAVFVAVTGRVIQLRRELFTVTMSAGAVAWLAGNALWLRDWPLARVAPWWIAFLALTIVGERLDLARFQKPQPAARPLLLAALGLFLGGVGASAVAPSFGERVVGAGLLALAAWLGRFDIARRTVGQAGLPRFMAVCLLGGYIWLAAAGALFLGCVPLQAGGTYDAALHAFFLGFVFAMIFGHAPVIFPAVLQLAPVFHPRFYAHVALLHGSLLLRLAGDLAGSVPARQWGGALNGVALVLFLLNTASALVFPQPAGSSRAQQQGL